MLAGAAPITVMLLSGVLQMSCAFYWFVGSPSVSQTAVILVQLLRRTWLLLSFCL